MEEKRFYIKHLSKGYLLRTKSRTPEYSRKFDPNLVWIGTKEQTLKRIKVVGEQLHDLGEWIC